MYVVNTVDKDELYALMPGHAAIFGETVYGCGDVRQPVEQEPRGRLGRVIMSLQEGGASSKPNGRISLVETCDMAVVAIDEPDAPVENSVMDMAGNKLCLAAKPADVFGGQSVQTFCSDAGRVRGTVKLVGFTSRESPYICDCIGLVRDSGDPLHGFMESGLLVTDIPAMSCVSETAVSCLAMLIAVQKIPIEGELTRVFSLAVPMTRVFQRLQEQKLFRNSGRLSFTLPSVKSDQQTSSLVSTVDLQEEGVVSEVGDPSTIATASRV